MSVKRLLIGLSASVSALAIMFVPATAFATAGQVEGGDIYRVRNVTKNGAFTEPATAAKCETVQFKVRIHNPGPEALSGVSAKATLPTTAGTFHSSTMTITAANGNPATTSDQTGVQLSESLKLSYVAGSTQLLDANGAFMSTLADGIVGSGVNIPGGVGVSIQQKRFVQFNAKVECPKAPQPKPAASCKAMSATVIGDAKKLPVKVNFNTTVTLVDGATVSKYVYNFGDGATLESATPAVSHSYTKFGTFNATVTVKTSVGDRTATACAATITLKEDVVVPPVTPELPNTGVGSMLGLFAGVSSLGAAAHYVVSARRRF